MISWFGSSNAEDTRTVKIKTYNGSEQLPGNLAARILDLEYQCESDNVSQ